MSTGTAPPELPEVTEDPPAETAAPVPEGTVDLTTNVLYLAETVRTLQLDAAELHKQVTAGGRP